MQVSVEANEGLERRLTITVPADTVDSAVKTRLQQLAKTQRINGFRPGKVPISVIRKRFGLQVRQEIASDVIQRNFYEAVMQEKLNPAGMPTFEMKTDEDGKDFEFVAAFEIYPEIELKDLDQIEVEKAVVEITDENLANMLETLRKQHATWADVDREVADEDRVTIDFVGSVDGEEFEGGKAEDFALEMGKGRMVPGFEEPMVGKKAGEEFTIDVTFPEDYHAEQLKGKAAQFAIVLKKVEAQELPELDEEFAKIFGIEDGDLDKLKAEVKRNMQRELDQALKTKLKEQVISGLIDKNPIDLPAALVEQEIEALRKQSLERFGQQGSQANLPELPNELFEENARRRVSVGLLLGQVISQKEIKADSARVEEMIATSASAYEDPQEVIEYYKSNQELMTQMENLAVEDQAIDDLLDNAKVSEVVKDFDDIMNKQG